MFFSSSTPTLSTHTTEVALINFDFTAEIFSHSLRVKSLLHYPIHARARHLAKRAILLTQISAQKHSKICLNLRFPI
ncbi:hypothetical protein DMC01_00255 [Campylobacter troglodytis]|nr:hypothetical protein DMC01_00255 [Campylobacter troglodytis]